MGRRGNSNYSILFDVEFETKQVERALQQVKRNMKSPKFELDTSGAQDSVKKLGRSMGDVQLTFNAANEVFRTTIDVIKSMSEQVYELDGALTEFRKVSDLSGQALDDYVGKLQIMGDEVARTGSEMIEAATTFRKNGFNDEDAATLGLVASKFQNVADDAVSAGDAASFIISQMMAFDIGADSAEHIIDAVNEVSNSFSVSSTDISKSLGNMSAVMSQTGASFEQSLGIAKARSSKTG